MPMLLFKLEGDEYMEDIFFAPFDWLYRQISGGSY